LQSGFGKDECRKEISMKNNTETRNLAQLDATTGNIYQSITIVSQRANQIQALEKEELQEKLKDFTQYSENIEEFFENREQIEISKYYERLPKPALRALDEFEEERIAWRIREENEG
jgi:DNA-directed RNA polymerase subunit K/omega